MYLLAMSRPPVFRLFLGAAALLAGFLLNSCVNEPQGAIYYPTPPTVVHTAPVHLETGVALDRAIAASFNVPMDPNTITPQTFVVLRGSGPGADTVRGTVAYTSGDTTATFTPNDSLLKCETYTVFLTAGALDSLCNVPLDTSWSFTTPSPAPTQPVITDASPENLEGNVALNTVVTAIFDVPMDPNSINTSTFKVTRATGIGPVPIPGTVSYAPGTHTATFTPNADLPKCQYYTASISAATPDSLCSILAVDSVWTFNTMTLPVAPVITQTSPVDLDGNVALDGNITATFNVPMDPNSINGLTFTVKRGFGNSAVPVTGAVSYDAGTNTATFNPDDSLVKCQPYTVTINASTLDSICSRLAVDSTWSFTIPNKIILMPAVQTSPVDLEGNVSLNSSITAIFNVAMSPFSINNQTFLVVRDGQSGPDTISGSVSYTPLTKTATFIPNADLLPNEHYSVYLNATMDSLCIQLVFDTSWTFTTNGVPPPLPPPLDLPLQDVHLFAVTLFWEAVLPGPATYQLQVSTSPTFATTVYDVSGLTGTSQAVNGILPFTVCYWRVRVTNGDGTSAWSVTRTFTKL